MMMMDVLFPDDVIVDWQMLIWVVVGLVGLFCVATIVYHKFIYQKNPLIMRKSHIHTSFNEIFIPFIYFSYLYLKVTGRHTVKAPSSRIFKNYLKKEYETLVGPQGFIIKALDKIEVSMDDPSCPMNPFGRFLLKYAHITNTIKLRSQVIEYALKHPLETQRVSFRRPIIVTGLPRSGTSFLQGLLACDPHSRGVRGWEFFTPLPPVASSESYYNDFRGEWFARKLKLIHLLDRQFLKLLTQSHLFESKGFEEESFVLWQSQVATMQAFFLDDQKFFDYLHEESEEKRTAYTYMKVFLSVIGSKYGPGTHPDVTHFCLKSPFHMLFPSLMFETFDDARVVVCQRHPTEVVPSWTRLVTIAMCQYPDVDPSELDPFLRRVGTRCLDQLSMMYERMHRYRQEHPERVKDKVIDVSFRSLTINPIETVKKLYEVWGYEYTEEFERRMTTFIADCKIISHPYGKPVFDPCADFGLTTKRIEDKFAHFLENYKEYL